MEENKPTSIRLTDKLKRRLSYESAELDISLSEYLLQCILLGRAIVREYPQASKQFDESVIRSDYNSRRED